MKALRTHDASFAKLPDYEFAPNYTETADGDGGSLRIHYLDEGPATGSVVLLLHGEPSWSYLYRHMIPVLTGAGLRVVAPDLVGFGRSDKPTQVSDHTYSRHVGWMRAALFDSLDLRGITLVAQDWGGLIGLRLVAEQPDRFTRLVAANTGLPDGQHRMPPEWWRFHDFVARTPDLPVGFLVAAGCATELAPEVVAAYDAPFPGPEYKAGPRAMPGLIPQSPDDPETPAQEQAWEVLRRFEQPFLTAFSDGDPITRGVDRPMRDRIPGSAGQPHTTIEGAGHFLQEDRGRELAQVVVEFIRGTSQATP